MSKNRCIVAVIILCTLILSGCIGDSLTQIDLYGISVNLEYGQTTAINISDLGLDADSIANLTNAFICISLTVTKIVGPHIQYARYEVKIVNGQLVAQADKGIGWLVEEKMIYRVDLKYNISSGDHDLKGLNLLGDPKGNNFVSWNVSTPKKNNVDFNNWLKIDGINSTEGKVYKVERSAIGNSNAGKIYVLSMYPYSIKVVFDFTAS